MSNPDMTAVAELQVNRAEVRRRREALGLTMEQAATAAGLRSRQAWYNLEANPRERDVSVSMLGRLARALQCEPEDLLTRTDD